MADAGALAIIFSRRTAMRILSVALRAAVLCGLLAAGRCRVYAPLIQR